MSVEISNEIPSKEEIDEIFAKYYVEEYVPEGQTEKCPEYVPTPRSCGPQPISIETYLKRKGNKIVEEVQPITIKRKRGGKRLQTKNKRRDIQRLMGISSGEQKRQLYIELKRINGEPRIKKRKNK